MMSHKRPISPHLTIYKPQISSVLSITHRMTGLWLAAGAVLMVAWLYIAAYQPAHYANFHECISSIFGQLCLFAWVAAFYYHLGNGVRHLFWDIGKGYTIPQLHASGWTVVLFSLLMTAITWGFVRAGL